jgi:hypothetical protein
VLFGCLEAASWIVSDPQGGELAACEADLDVLLNGRAGPGAAGLSAASGWRSGVPEDRHCRLYAAGSGDGPGCGTPAVAVAASLYRWRHSKYGRSRRMPRCPL